MDEMLKDLQRVKEQEKRLDRFIYDIHGEYSIEQVEQHFDSWSQALETLNVSGKNESDKNLRGKGIGREEILSDLRRAARISELPFTPDKYDENGKYTNSTVSRNIGSWKKAKEEADIVEIEEDKAAEISKWISDQLGVQEDLSEGVKEFLNDLEKNIENRHVLGAYYCALRANDIPYTMKDISRIINNTDKQEVYQGYKEISAVLDEYIGTISSEAFVRRYSDELGLSDELKEESIKISKKVESRSSSPNTFAAAIIYLVCKQNDEKVTQRTIANLSHNTTVSIRNNKDKIEERLDF